jgi:hypothetical protein
MIKFHSALMTPLLHYVYFIEFRNVSFLQLPLISSHLVPPSMEKTFCFHHLRPTQKLVLTTPPTFEVEVFSQNFAWYANWHIVTEFMPFMKKLLPSKVCTAPIVLKENLSNLYHACFELYGDYLIGTRFLSDQSWRRYFSFYSYNSSCI